MAFDKVFAMRVNRLAKKKFLIDSLGGKCEHCGDSRFYIMHFHHDCAGKEKTFNICSHNNNRLSELVEELKKCILLCANCHHKHHVNNNNEYDQRTNTKRTLFEYMGTSACKCCGENDSRILNFHHIRNKRFVISNWLTNKNIKCVDKLNQHIKDEVDNCILLCPNCHLEEHLDKDFYEKYYDLVVNKSKIIRENVKPLDKELVKKMFLSGMKQIDIARHFCSVKSTVCGILKDFGLTSPNGEKTYDREIVLKLHTEGTYNKDIMSILNISRTTLFCIYKELNITSNINPSKKRFKKN